MGIEAWGWGSALPLVCSLAVIKPREKKWIKTVSWGVADMAFRPKHLKEPHRQHSSQNRMLKQGFPWAERSTNNIYTVYLMYSHFLVYLSVVASPSVFDIHILILSQLNVHAFTHENVACAHKHKQTGHTVYDTILKMCVFVVPIQYHLSDCLHTTSVCVCVCVCVCECECVCVCACMCVCVCVRVRAVADNLISPV